MTVRDGLPDAAQARMMAKVFVIATILGALVVFLNVTLRSYNLRLQIQAEKEKKAAEGTAAPAPEAAATPAPQP